MIDFMTTKEAAEYLGISYQRVNQLIRAGRLEAVKTGRDWLVSLKSVEARLKSEPRPGRPKGGVP